MEEKAQIKECGKMKGKFKIAVLKQDGEEIYRETENLIMNAGLAEVSGLILTDIGGNAFDYLAIGTSNTAPAAAQTTLGAETYRAAATGTQQTTTVSNDTARLSTSIAITSTETLQEAGVFNSSSNGDMLARSTYSGVSVNSGDTVNLGYEVAFS
jgi:hypothetical protein